MYMETISDRDISHYRQFTSSQALTVMPDFRKRQEHTGVGVNVLITLSALTDLFF